MREWKPDQTPVAMLKKREMPSRTPVAMPKRREVPSRTPVAILRKRNDIQNTSRYAEEERNDIQSTSRYAEREKRRPERQSLCWKKRNDIQNTGRYAEKERIGIQNTSRYAENEEEKERIPKACKARELQSLCTGPRYAENWERCGKTKNNGKNHEQRCSWFIDERVVKSSCEAFGPKHGSTQPHRHWQASPHQQLLVCDHPTWLA